MKDRITVGFIGLGVVGTGAVRLLQENADLIKRRLGAPVVVKTAAVRNLRRDRGLMLPPGVLVDDPRKVIEDPDIDIVVELIGGHQPAKEFILAAMARGKHVVTANKALLAADGAELHAAARRSGLRIAYEGSVGGGIPVVKALCESLAGNRIISVYGIINGTCNYILTKMTEEERPFPDVLAEAQRAGYAEADPSFDVDGIDTSHKLAILAHLAFGAYVELKDIYTEGIRRVTPTDIDFGREFGYRVKLLAIAKHRDGKVEARVHPTMVPEDYPIAQVGGVYNAIQIVGDACGDIMLYGRGAGAAPTGSAVVGDIMDIGRYILLSPSRHLPPADDQALAAVQPMDAIQSIYYMRVMALDQPGVLSQISGILGQHRISIAQVIQRGRKQGGAVPLVILTHTALERDVQEALVRIEKLSCVSEKPVLIRVEGEEP